MKYTNSQRLTLGQGNSMYHVQYHVDVHKVFIEDKAYKSYMWDTFVEMNKYYELMRRGKCSLSPAPLQTRPRGSTFCCKKKERKKEGKKER
jgi:hypothetical protein